MLSFKTIGAGRGSELRRLQINYPDRDPLDFVIDRYNLLAKNRSKDINNDVEDGIYLYPVNMFFRSLDEDTRLSLYDMYTVIHKAVIALPTQAPEIAKGQIHHVLKHNELFDKLITFCNGSLFAYPDLQDVGTREHHTNDKTFKRNEFVELTALSIFSKMMIPILGGLDFILPPLSKIEQIITLNEVIEPYLIDSEFDTVHHKLENFIITSVEKYIQRYPLPHKVSKDDIVLFILSKVIIDGFYKYDGIVFSTDDTVPHILVYISKIIQKIQKDVNRSLARAV